MLVFILGLILPITYIDDILYALGRHPETNIVFEGNVLQQQIQEYLTWHGRFFTHIWARIVLQNRFTADLLMSLFNFAVFYTSWKTVQITNRTNQPSILWALCLALIIFFLHGWWIVLIHAVHFLSYRLTFVMLLLFLIPYLRFFADDNKSPNMILFSLISLIAGSTHEQSVVLIPILILMGIIYSYFLKKKLPSWYYLGVFLFFLGYLTLFLSPNTFSESRLAGYGEATNWDFFGQKLNWLELGWEKYLYGLVKVLHKWLPVAIAPMIFFIVMLVKSIKKQGFSFDLVPSIVLFVISHAIVVVLMFTPTIYISPMSLGMDFLIVSCFSILTLYLNIINFNFKKHEKKIITTVIAITLITWGIQIPFAIQYRLAHNERVHIIKEAIKNHQSEVIVKKLPRYGITTPFGNIRMIYPPITEYLMQYQGLTNIDITIIE